jgi:hypothetical protein
MQKRSKFLADGNNNFCVLLLEKEEENLQQVK